MLLKIDRNPLGLLSLNIDIPFFTRTKSQYGLSASIMVFCIINTFIFQLISLTILIHIVLVCVMSYLSGVHGQSLPEY